MKGAAPLHHSCDEGLPRFHRPMAKAMGRHIQPRMSKKEEDSGQQESYPFLSDWLFKVISIS